MKCADCHQEFSIKQEDREFYDRVSPVIAGKKFPVRPPSLCPPCRSQRRHAWRNERHLHKQPCDLTKQTVISLYAPDEDCTVYVHDQWWTDVWDPLSFGRTFEPSKPFFEQFRELIKTVPRPSIHVIGNENCEFVNQCGYSKNCYLSFNTDWCENCYYCCNVIRSRDCMDLFNAEACELCAHGVDLQNCYRVVGSARCKNSSDLKFCTDILSCSHCFGCINLRNKKYCFYNEQLTKEEYEKRIKEFSSESFAAWNQGMEKARAFQLTQPRRCTEQLECDNCSGDNLRNCKNVRISFDCFNDQDIAYCTVTSNCRDSADCDTGGYESELCYELISSGMSNQRCSFSTNLWGNNSDLFYCEIMVGCKHCFGCIALRHKEYCILNKQYTKEQYEELVPTIIERMQEDHQWGEFFPMALSPIPYNESVAQQYFPLTKAEAKRRNLRWRDVKDEMGSPKKVIPAEKLPDATAHIPDDVLNWAITSSTSGRPFKIIKQELDLCRSLGIPLPRLHPDERHDARLASRNPRQLWKRECMKCGKEMETTYAPGRPETVYCEKCYLEAVY